jgi:hypothetical protein
LMRTSMAAGPHRRQRNAVAQTHTIFLSLYSQEYTSPLLYMHC